MHRRTLLRAAPVAATAGVAGCLGILGGGGGGQSLESYLENARGYDGSVTDRTDADEVTVAVGAGDQGQAFGPAAVEVSTGTRIVWEWTGEGGSHNVVHEGGNFSSNFSEQEGHTYTKTFDSERTVLYFCKPHKAVGMKGAVRVV